MLFIFISLEILFVFHFVVDAVERGDESGKGHGKRKGYGRRLSEIKANYLNCISAESFN